MSKGIMGCLMESRGISFWQTETTQTLVFMLKLLTSRKEHQAITTHNTYGHCRVRFYASVEQSWWKKQYSKEQLTTIVYAKFGGKQSELWAIGK